MLYNIVRMILCCARCTRPDQVREIVGPNFEGHMTANSDYEVLELRKATRNTET